MPLQRSFEPRPGYLYVRVAGSYDLEEAVLGIGEALKACDEHGFDKILVDFQELQGGLPLFTESYIYISQVARQVVLHNNLSGKKLRIAYLGRNLGDMQPYSEQAAAEHGIERFVMLTNELDQALDWLGVQA